MSDRSPYEYIVVRVVPRVERGECINAGVVLICRPHRFLDARIELNQEKVRALDPSVSNELLATIEKQLQLMCLIARGAPEGGSLAQMTIGERWHLLSAPSSTMLQPSAVHTGLTRDPGAELNELFELLVLPPVNEVRTDD